jgi:hypothetical protein
LGRNCAGKACGRFITSKCRAAKAALQRFSRFVYCDLWQDTGDYDFESNFGIGIHPDTFQVYQTVEQQRPHYFELAVSVEVFISDEMKFVLACFQKCEMETAVIAHYCAGDCVFESDSVLDLHFHIPVELTFVVA